MKTSVQRAAGAVLFMLLALAPAFAQGTVAPVPSQQFGDNNGNPLAFGKLFVYAAGTTTPATIYADATLTVPALNAAICGCSNLSASGRFTYFLAPSTYRFTLKSATDVLIWDVDGVPSVPPANVNLDVQGTAGEALTFGDAVYLSDGSGAKTAGRWYKASATNTYSSSSATAIGMVPAGIAAGNSGSIRLSGNFTTASGVSIGTDYYIAAAAGTITSTPPTNARKLGRTDTTSSIVLTETSVLSGPASALTLTAHGVVLGNGASAVTATAAMTTGQLLVGVTGADPAPTAAATAGASLVLLKQGSGTDSSTVATNVDTIAMVPGTITGLTAKDRLIVEVSGISVTQQTAGLVLQNSTDGVTLVNLAAGGAIAAGEVLVTRDVTAQSQASATSIWSFAKGRTTVAGAAENLTVAAVTQAYTGTWTLALRHTGVTAGGTLQWQWAVYIEKGQ